MARVVRIPTVRGPRRPPSGSAGESFRKKSALGALFEILTVGKKKMCPLFESRTVKLPPWRSDRIRCLRDRRRVDRERPRSDRPNANRECFPLTWHVSPVNDDSTVKLSAPERGSPGRSTVDRRFEDRARNARGWMEKARGKRDHKDARAKAHGRDPRSRTERSAREQHLVRVPGSGAARDATPPRCAAVASR